MLNFFRRAINTKVGKAITFVVLGVVAVLFGIGGISLGGPAATGDTVATVGKVGISANELRSRAENDLRNYQQQYQGLTPAVFVAQGGLDASYDTLVYGAAIEQFAAANHLGVSDTYIQGMIAGESAFQGVDGKFNQQKFDEFLQRQNVTYAQFSQNYARGLLGRLISFPISQQPSVPQKLAAPYATALLEKRDAQIALIPIAAMPQGPKPDDATVAQYYQRNLARYVVPERRAIRYAIISPDSVKAAATPSDADVAAAYKAGAAKYAAVQKRTVSQVVIADAKAAGDLAAKVKGGTAIAAAAKAIGLEAATLKDTDQAAYAGDTSAEASNAVFAVAQDGTVGPIKVPLGYLVAHVDAITNVAARSLDQVKPELVKTLTQQRTMAALSRLHDSLDDAINAKATFAELVASNKLTAETTAPIAANGVDPENPSAKPDPKLAPIVAAAFAVDPAEGPQMVPIGQDGTFALIGLDRTIPAAPRPLKDIRDKVAADVQADAARIAARKVAGGVIAAVNKGTPLAQALAATKLSLKPVQPLGATRAQQVASQGRSPPLTLMFTMREHTATVIDAPNGDGFIILYLAKVTPGDINSAAGTATQAGVRKDLIAQQSAEYGQQFSKAVRAAVGYKRNDAAVDKVKAALTGQGGSDQN